MHRHAAVPRPYTTRQLPSGAAWQLHLCNYTCAFLGMLDPVVQLVQLHLCVSWYACRLLAVAMADASVLNVTCGCAVCAETHG